MSDYRRYKTGYVNFFKEHILLYKFSYNNVNENAFIDNVDENAVTVSFAPPPPYTHTRSLSPYTRYVPK